jgi:hypothetical protein
LDDNVHCMTDLPESKANKLMLDIIVGSRIDDYR